MAIRIGRFFAKISGGRIGPRNERLRKIKELYERAKSKKNPAKQGRLKERFKAMKATKK